MSKPRIGVILSTTRDQRFADTANDWLAGHTGKREDMEFEIIDLRDFPLPYFEEAMSPMYGPAANPVAQKWAAKIGALDGFIFVVAEYNRSLPGALKNTLDYAYPEYNRKPAAFVGYGGVGAARAIEHLRLICIELQMAPTRTGVHIGLEPFLAVLQHGKNLSDFEFLNTSAEQMLDEFSWWVNALRNARQAS